MRITLKPEEAYHLINHGPCNLITTGDGTRKNVAPINWTMPVNMDPARLVSVVEEGTTTHGLISETGEFAVNVCGEPLVEKVLACGRCHGADVDKFSAFGLTPQPCQKIRAPYIKESLGHIECRVIGRHAYEDVTLFVAEVLHASVEESVWDGTCIIPEKAKTIHHLTKGSFAVAERTIAVSKETLDRMKKAAGLQ